MGRRFGLLLGLLALAVVSVSSPRVRCFAADLSGVWVAGSERLELRRTGEGTYAATLTTILSSCLVPDPQAVRTAVYRDGVLQMDSPLYSSGAVRDRLFTVLTPKGVVLAADPRGGEMLVPASQRALPSLRP